MRLILGCATAAAIAFATTATIQTPAQPPQPKYDLLLKGGHVVDGRNNINSVRDVAIAGEKIAAVAANISDGDALGARHRRT